MRRPLKSEIWRYIFRYFVEPDFHHEDDYDTSLPPGFLHGSRAQILASVCQIWRKIATADRTLWSSIYISSNQPIVSVRRRAILYIQRSGGIISTILLHIDRDIGKSQWKQFSEVFFDIPRINVLECLVSSKPTANEEMTQLIKCMPIAQEVILRVMTLQTVNAEVEYQVPNRILGKAERVVARGCTVSLKMKPTISATEIEKISSFYPYPIASPRTTAAMVHEWSPALLSSLVRCTVDETYKLPSNSKARSDLPCLTSLTTLEIPLGLLLQIFYKSVRLPALTSLTIRNIVNATLEDWRCFVSTEDGGGRINEITVRPMSCEDAIALVPYITALPSLKALGLEGNSASRIIRRLYAALDVYHDTPESAPPNLNLSVLKIRSYSGEGRTLAQLLHLHSWLVTSPLHKQADGNPHLQPLRVQF
ncbi:hypothetical protein FRC17_006497 [Serendipita sp. 399]|nr:hypothetical protein FRC17_006497 [Serendipita sp. 399]